MTRSSTYQTMFYYLLNTIILMYFVGNGSKMKQKISTKISKHALVPFRDVISQIPQSGYFPRRFLQAIASKASHMYTIADKTSHNHRRFRPILSHKYRIRFCNVDFLLQPLSKESFS